MAVKTRIASKGVEEINGQTGCEIAQSSTNVGFAPFQLTSAAPAVASAVNTAQGLWSVTVPGFYYVSGSSQGGVGCTGSVPAASSFPGATLDFVGANAFPFCLSGSVQIGALGQMPAFHMAFTSSLGQGAARGCLVDVPAAGAITLKSTGYQWLITAASGSLLIRS